MMKITSILIIVLISGLLFSAEAIAKYDTLIPENTYPFWGKYQDVPVNDIRAQEWRTKEDIIDGWDWSLPSGIKPSPRSLIGIQRYSSLNGIEKNINTVNLQFPANPVTVFWINWKQIEPEEDKYEWDKVRNMIETADKKGTGSILRILTVCKARTDAGEKNGYAPLWLKKYKIKTITYKDHKTIRHRATINYDPADPIFHKYYVKLVRSLKKSGIPKMSALKGAYVGYESPSHGEEGIGPKKDLDQPHVKERLNTWAEAFKEIEHKVFMGGPSPHGFSKGFGIRQGFVEMYLYKIPEFHLGQEIDPRGYLQVDENAQVIRNNCFNGDENEEYDPSWATKSRQFRFGNSVDAFPYRYFTSMLRLLQMRATYVLHRVTVIPEMLAYVGQEMGRTVRDTPDIWCWLRESHMKASTYKNKDKKGRKITDEEKKNGIPIKNFERWLYQRDTKDSPTVPAIKIKQAYRLFMVQPGKEYDHIARAGKRIGFGVDDRFLNGGPHKVAVKISYFDLEKGKLRLLYSKDKRNKKGQRTINLKKTGKLHTATFFLKDAYFNAKGMEPDLVIEGEPEAVISFVRIIKL